MMKKTYNIEVDCANCANLVEAAVNKLDGVVSATINYMTQKMIVELEDGADEKKMMKLILKTGRKVEPDFDIEL